MRFGSERSRGFEESVIREMTRHAVAHDALNLAQGFPDFPVPDWLKEAALTAVSGDKNQYSITWGGPDLRQAICAKHLRDSGVSYDPDTEVTITCGTTEGMLDAALGLFDPGDEVIVWEPTYENYIPNCLLTGATPRIVPLRPPNWELDEHALRSAFSSKTKAVILCSPNNPTGKVFTADELRLIGELAEQHDALIFVDSIYEHMVYAPAEHHYLAALDGGRFRERILFFSGLSKSFSATGWRIGWVLGPAALMLPVRKVHDYATVAAPTPFQMAAVKACSSPPEGYFDTFVANYRERRDLLSATLRACGYEHFVPEGAYYIMADTSAVDPAGDDRAFALKLVREAGIASVPGYSFFPVQKDVGHHYLRFCFAKSTATLREVDLRLRKFHGIGS